MRGTPPVTRPDARQLDVACDLLARLARAHGLANLRHGAEPGEVVADVAGDRTYFDVLAFEEAVERRLCWRLDVVSAAARGVRPGRLLGPDGEAA